MAAAFVLAAGVPIAAWAGPPKARAVPAGRGHGAAGHRGVWLEIRLAEGSPAVATTNGVLSTTADNVTGIPAEAPFVAGYRFGRAWVGLGLNLVRDNGARGAASASATAVGVTSLWLAPTAGYAILPAVGRRPSLYLEAALHLALASAPPVGSAGSQLSGLGARLAFGARTFLAPAVAVGAEAGVAYDEVTLTWNVVGASSRQTALGFYGAFTLSIVVG